MNLIKDCKITRVMNAVAAGTTEQKSSVLDMSGYDGVCFILLLNAVTDASVITATIYENTASSTSSPAPVTSGVAATLTALSSSNLVMAADLVRPVSRYVFLDITRITQNAAIDGVLAIQYRTNDIPVTQSGLIASAFGFAS
jgi:hypothetical protein